MTAAARGVAVRVGTLALPAGAVSRPELVGPVFEAALTRLLRERGVPAAWTTGAAVSPQAPVQLTLAGDADALGEQLARAVYEGLAG